MHGGGCGRASFAAPGFRGVQSVESLRGRGVTTMERGGGGGSLAVDRRRSAVKLLSDRWLPTCSPLAPKDDTHVVRSASA